ASSWTLSNDSVLTEINRYESVVLGRAGRAPGYSALLLKEQMFEITLIAPGDGQVQCRISMQGMQISGHWPGPRLLACFLAARNFSFPLRLGVPAQEYHKYAKNALRRLPLQRSK